MPVSGLVVTIDPTERDSIITALRTIPGLELTPTPAGGALVAVIDVSTTREEESIFMQINDLTGVRQVSLSYHNFEDLTDHSD